MAFAAIIIGAIVIVAALNGTHTQLAAQLEADVPGFFKWAAALVVILAIGMVPGLRSPSRWLLALVALVVFLINYKAIISGVQTFATSSGQPSAPAPAATATAPATTAPFGGIGGLTGDFAQLFTVAGLGL